VALAKQGLPATPPHRTGLADFPHPALLRVFVIDVVNLVLGYIGRCSFLSDGGICAGCVGSDGDVVALQRSNLGCGTALKDSRN